MKKYALIAIAAVACFQAHAQTFEPVNKNASPEARKLLAYLYSIKGKYILSGEHNYNGGQVNKFSDSVYKFTGKYPAVWGSDFLWAKLDDKGKSVVDEAIKKWNEGYIITLNWHEGRPTDDPPYDWRKSILGKLTDAEWDSLTTPNTALNKRWLDQIDHTAIFLKQLSDAHVPVLWRPYHEMNGVWFWWGNRKGKDGFAKLWKMMYDRYVNYHHLNNLIWVYSCSGIKVPIMAAYDYKDYYPGPNYVDILGADDYFSHFEQNNYDEMLSLAKGKLVAMTEVGTLPTPAVIKAQPQWCYFLNWATTIWTDNKPDSLKIVYSYPHVLNHDQVKATVDAIR